MSDNEAERHRRKMVHRKAVQDKKVAERTATKGLLMVYTGKGKGKSTAAFGMALRMLGRRRGVGVVQFIKGTWHSAEYDALHALAAALEVPLKWHIMGEGFTWDTQDKERDIAAASAAWDTACQLMQDRELDLIILDELNIALRYGYLPLESVVDTLKARRPDLHIAVTGRNAKPLLCEAADLVSEVDSPKHPFDAGIKAQEGIEY